MRTSSPCVRYLALVAGSLPAAACSADVPATDSEDPDYVVLVDDDSEPDQVRGEAGR